jgi:uncharacterized NAD(P)/FAD-binding protein YdhS
MKSDDAVADVAIIGAGFSGTMMAAQLARRGISSLLIEGSDRAGRGTAYSTTEDAHLLNVPAQKMSAWSHEPSHFADAVAGEGYGPGDFVPRKRFGTYLTAILDEAVASGLVGQLDRRAVRAAPEGDGWTIQFSDGSSATARSLVLAQGNQPPDRFRAGDGLPDDLFINDPWSDSGREAIRRVAEEGGDVLIIGTGLTMVDVVLSLDEAGHGGSILALSRRGQVPHGHAAYEESPVAAEDVPHGSVTSLWRWLRRRAGRMNWRAAVDSLRPHSHRLWQSLDPAEQRRFIRHARAWWDVHRHRIAPEISARLKGLVAGGRLQVMAGRIVSIEAGNPGLDVVIKRRGTDQGRTRHFALAINCTGPLGAIEHSEDGVIRTMLGAGLARPDALGMGLAVDARSRIEGARRAWALGPLAKGAYWEIVAVPDIREQVALVADDMARELGR